MTTSGPSWSNSADDTKTERGCEVAVAGGARIDPGGLQFGGHSVYQGDGLGRRLALETLADRVESLFES